MASNVCYTRFCGKTNICFSYIVGSGACISVLPVKEVTEHLIVSRLIQAAFKKPWFFVKLEK